jgi:hypothetical protein
MFKKLPSFCPINTALWPRKPGKVAFSCLFRETLSVVSSSFFFGVAFSFSLEAVTEGIGTQANVFRFLQKKSASFRVFKKRRKAAFFQRFFPVRRKEEAEQGAISFRSAEREARGAARI